MAVRAFRHYTEIPPDYWRWGYFAPQEIASRGDGSIVVVEEALDALMAVREALGIPMRINSAYRDPIHNARVGGAPLSRHKIGDAFDVSLAGHNREALRDACRRAGFRGFGYYRTFLHVDLGPRREWGKWATS